MKWWTKIKNRLSKSKKQTKTTLPSQNQWKEISKLDWEQIGRSACTRIEGLTPLVCDNETVLKDRISYHTFSGVDTKLYKRDFAGVYTHLLINSISFEFTPNVSGTKVKGTIIATIFNHSLWTLCKGAQDLVIFAADEYGNLGRQEFLSVKMQTLSSGVGIDDIIIEERVDFTAADMSPWQPMQEGSYTIIQRAADNAR